MFLKSLTIKNFRKFRSNQKIEFAHSSRDIDQSEEEKINVASDTTLVVGKNNVGKTSVVIALEKLVNNRNFEHSDFNYYFLEELLEEYKNKVYNNFPFLEFEIQIGIDNLEEDKTTHISKFLMLDNFDLERSNNLTVIIRAKYEVVEVESFINSVKENIVCFARTFYTILQRKSTHLCA